MFNINAMRTFEIIFILGPQLKADGYETLLHKSYIKLRCFVELRAFRSPRSSAALFGGLILNILYAELAPSVGLKDCTLCGANGLRTKPKPPPLGRWS